LNKSDLELAGLLDRLFNLPLLGILRHLALVDDVVLDVDIATLVNLCEALVDHVLEDGGGVLVGGGFLLGQVVLLLELVVLLDLLLDCLLPQLLLGQLVGDLPGGPPPLDAGLEHVHAVALLSYRLEKNV